MQKAMTLAATLLLTSGGATSCATTKSDYPTQPTQYWDIPELAEPVSFTYPVEAVPLGYEAQCEVRFRVNDQNVAEDIVASCSNDMFVATVEDMVRRARFRDDSLRGVQVVLPFVFALEG